jgi:hypothetical protein
MPLSDPDVIGLEHDVPDLAGTFGYTASASVDNAPVFCLTTCDTVNEDVRSLPSIIPPWVVLIAS